MVKNESGTECTIEKYERVGGGGEQFVPKA